MRRRFAPGCALGRASATALTVFAALVLQPARGRATESAADCRRCHLAEQPDKATATLRPCPRPAEAAAKKSSLGRRGPQGVIVLDMAAGAAEADVGPDLYGPVRFDHGRHAAWAETGRGCASCHHGKSLDVEHPQCRTCHAARRESQDFRRLGLKGAYHRQCLGCHREWSHDTGCSACHAPKAGAATPVAALPPAADDIVGSTHPPLAPQPAYEKVMDYPEPEGSKVSFSHQRHVDTYRVRCVECHRGDSCGRCHGGDGAGPARDPLPHFSHQVCGACHETEDDAGGACDKCHRDRLAGPGQAFDHTSTGWPLTAEHQDVSCRACHGDTPYRKRSRECGACHDSWVDGTISHERLTGLRLDGPHVGLDCDECHTGERFALPATCDGCHTGELGTGALPGTRVAR